MLLFQKLSLHYFTIVLIFLGSLEYLNTASTNQVFFNDKKLHKQLPFVPPSQRQQPATLRPPAQNKVSKNFLKRAINSQKINFKVIQQLPYIPPKRKKVVQHIPYISKNFSRIKSSNSKDENNSKYIQHEVSPRICCSFENSAEIRAVNGKTSMSKFS